MKGGKLILNIKSISELDKVELVFAGEDDFSGQLDHFCLQDICSSIKKAFLLKNFNEVIINSLNFDQVSVDDDSLTTLEGRKDYIYKVIDDLANLVNELHIDIELDLELSDEIIDDIFSDSGYYLDYLNCPSIVNYEE
ncbi:MULTISPECIES: hypothetical protein [unclassified Candidatus Frackibacter]|uniref:hypothetical protein n=1 Tax=unclassified Candidatus Frackibacter TaxID=2648818 RepID=UPI000890A4F8|nr:MULTISPECIES: hypothetical protein [unclassified Candidatus Frackibacter]SDC59837.1 hypothetical protein SAMN04515661_11541 [Candidatus Frackibacter sp. WG11]SEM42021.1 hypothetical protein SAMN04488698_103115 [Candidatus Frackibacter sp. WG12]SFL84738.1 hypothetical protein SAMN04488699_11622 [Candidatus Frackibacter sp. WG13]